MNYVIIGGGIAAVSCVEAIHVNSPRNNIFSITVITASPLVKTVTNVEQVGLIAQSFDVEERSLSWLELTYKNVTVVHAFVKSIDHSRKALVCRMLSTEKAGDVITVPYGRLCICTGGKPRSLDIQHKHDEFILTIRDTDSVRSLQNRIRHGVRRAVLVGNGGIATELAYELTNIDERVWIVKHATISATFVDAGAAEFFLQSIRNKINRKQQTTDCCTSNSPTDPEKTDVDGDVFHVAKYRKYTVEEPHDSQTEAPKSSDVHGSALGPDWLQRNTLRSNSNHNSRLHIEYQCQISRILSPTDMTPELQTRILQPHFMSSSTGGATTTNSDAAVQSATKCEVDAEDKCSRWPIYVQLTNGNIFGCDLIINATGVVPQHPPLLEQQRQLNIDETDGGILVDECMRTSLPDVYAAGDCCTAAWPHAPHWMQMRLWTQARQMGYYAGRCMTTSQQAETTMDFCFEIFTHVTKFFGFKVVLLGQFNSTAALCDSAADDKNHQNILVRIEPGEQYIKVILDSVHSTDDDAAEGVKQVVRGAILVGETDMEETLENLILNQTDVSRHGEHLLDPNVDVEDYFD